MEEKKTEENVMINKLPKNVINRITSLPLINDIKSVIKELIENSLDSSPTYIEIRCKNQGLTSIEVIDDGSGIIEDNFDLLCKRYCTSKINEDSLNDELITYGFKFHFNDKRI
jgi:hypothetical protein